MQFIKKIVLLFSLFMVAKDIQVGIHQAYDLEKLKSKEFIIKPIINWMKVMYHDLLR